MIFRCILILFLTLTANFVFSQNYTTCFVYQFLGTDSLNKKLVAEKKYNPKGQLISRSFQNFKESSGSGHSDATYSYSYKDSLLIKVESIDKNGDKTKNIYHYKKGKIIKQEYFDFKRRLKKRSHIGNGSSGGCIPSEKDFKRKSWEKTSVIFYTYDSMGNKILYQATELHYTNQNKYSYKYDDQHRVTEEKSFDNNRLIWIKAYNYFQGGYQICLSWYDYLGNPSHLKEKNEGYWPQYLYTYKLNELGKVIEEKVNNEKNEPLSTELTEYDQHGRVYKIMVYKGDGSLDLTSLYIYK